MSEPARELLLKLLRQAERGGRRTLPLTPASAPAYCAESTLAAREAIHAALQNAEQAGAVTLEWGKGAAARDLIRLRLRDIDSLAACLGVPRATDQAEAMAQALRPLLVQAPAWLQAAAETAQQQWRLGKPALRLANHQLDEAAALFRIAVAVSQGRQQGLDLRSFSVKLLADSKGIERRASRVAMLLRHNPAWHWCKDDKQLFRMLGLEKFPPLLLIKGPLQMEYGTALLDLAPYSPPFGLVPDRIRRPRPSRPAPYLLTIENLTSYHRYIREIDDDGIIIYSAGFPTPASMAILGALDAVLATDCGCFHWGDRDLGGLRIYSKLAEAFSCHRLRSHRMKVPNPNPQGAEFSADDLRWLLYYRQQPGVVAALAGVWLDAGLGMMEQEAMDPCPPGSA